MVWFVLIGLWMVYVAFSLSTIKHKLNLIMKHLKIEPEKRPKVSNEEIEKELEQR
ncbi:hypothetical protein [Neobacillus piezotolerans]|uniref:hypothetical protein n=1 Tax=Neobacillus piezotolerans TaxID=2259171 RepID=UPI0015F18217|nr:hypothetical protein [Neobacillus piezotolerans]